MLGLSRQSPRIAHVLTPGSTQMITLEGKSVGAARLGVESNERRIVMDGRNGMPCPHTIGVRTRPC